MVGISELHTSHMPFSSSSACAALTTVVTSPHSSQLWSLSVFPSWQPSPTIISCFVVSCNRLRIDCRMKSVQNFGPVRKAPEINDFRCFLVAGGDLKGPLASCLVLRAELSPARKASHFGSTASRKATPWLSCGADPRLPVASLPETLIKSKARLSATKRKRQHCVLPFPFGT